MSGQARLRKQDQPQAAGVPQTAEALEVRPFQPLGRYAVPTLPAEDWIKTAARRVKALFEGDDDAAAIDEDQLTRVSREQKAADVKPPICKVVVAEMDATFHAWAEDSEHQTPLRAVVFPPGDEHEVVAYWARRHGYEVMDPPSREALLRGERAEALDLRGEGLLVIPDLGRWFLRHRTGLFAIRSLLRQVGTLERRCLIGCNSWAWAFLSKAVEANMILPQPLMFEAFDGERLRAWLSAVADAARPGMRYRLPRTGRTVIPGGENSEAPDYFRRLAAQSLGIPWVAWWMWHNSIRSEIESEHDDESGSADDHPGDEADGQSQGMWLAELEEFALPNQHEPDELLVIQALLIHGPLTLEEVHAVVPAMRETSIVQALLSAALIERVNGRLRCRAAAYPAARRGLVAAGFPVDTL